MTVVHGLACVCVSVGVWLVLVHRPFVPLLLWWCLWIRVWWTVLLWILVPVEFVLVKGLIALPVGHGAEWDLERSC